MTASHSLALAALLMLGGAAALAAPETIVTLPPPSGTPTVGNAPRETVEPAFASAIPNIPGKSLTALVVTYAPGAKTPAHSHAKSAFITGYVLSGAIRSQVDDGPVQTFSAGQSWTEQPGAHHRVSENASDTEPAKLLAIFIVDSNDKQLLTVDPH